MSKKKFKKPDINIYILGSKGFTIGDGNIINQNYNNLIDLSTWSSTEKLALAYVAGFSDQTLYIDNEIETISLDVAEYIDEKYKNLHYSIQKSRDDIESKRTSSNNIVFSESEIKGFLTPILQAINDLIKENITLRNAFEDLQLKLEKRGSPSYIAISSSSKTFQVEPENLLQLAHLYFAEDKLTQATDALYEYLNAYPESEEGIKLLMEILVVTRKYNDAILWYEKCSNAKNNSDAIFFLIVAFINLERHSEAKREIESFSEKYPSDPRLKTLKTNYH